MAAVPARYVRRTLGCSLGHPGLSGLTGSDVLRLVTGSCRALPDRLREPDFRDVVLHYLAAADHQTWVVLDRVDTVLHDGHHAGRRACLCWPVAANVLKVFRVVTVTIIGYRVRVSQKKTVSLS